MAFNEDSSGSGHDEPWIQWFCGLKGHEMFCEVERSYIEDGFNLYGLRACVSNFSDCLDLILDRIGPDDSDDSHLTQSACTLYGLIHARYIITAHGLDAMYNKYAAKEFGTCPLAQCSGQPVLPVGLKDEMGADTVKIFCPKCQCVYHPPPIRSRSSSHHGGSGAAGVDGAAFGTTFPHLFLMTFSNLVPDPLPPNSAYIPRVFGFRVHMSARQRTITNTNSAINQTTSNTAVCANAAANAAAASVAAAAAATTTSSTVSAKNKNNNDDSVGKLRLNLTRKTSEKSNNKDNNEANARHGSSAGAGSGAAAGAAADNSKGPGVGNTDASAAGSPDGGQGGLVVASSSGKSQSPLPPDPKSSLPDQQLDKNTKSRSQSDKIDGDSGSVGASGAGGSSAGADKRQRTIKRRNDSMDGSASGKKNNSNEGNGNCFITDNATNKRRRRTDNGT